jgi:hypothetical protein
LDAENPSAPLGTSLAAAARSKDEGPGERRSREGGRKEETEARPLELDAAAAPEEEEEDTTPRAGDTAGTLTPR